MLEATASDIGGNFYIMGSEVPTFVARRSYRPLAFVAGVVFLVVCGLGALALALSGHTDLAPYVGGAGALGYFVSTIAAMIPQQVEIAIEGRRVVPSWRTPLEATDVRVGAWVVAGIDAATGSVVYVRGRRGKALRIGGERHDAEGYPVEARPSHTVDCHMPAGDFDRLLAALEIQRTPIDPRAPLVVPLVRNRQNLAGVARDMLPWVAAMTLIGVGGGLLSSSDSGRRFLSSSGGQLATGIGSAVIALIAIGWIIVRGRRVRMPTLELRVDGDEIALGKLGGATIVRGSLRELSFQRLRYTVRTRYSSHPMPVIELRFPDRSLRIGAWDPHLAWGEQDGAGATSTWRSPTWLVASTVWPKLVAALERGS